MTSETTGWRPVTGGFLRDGRRELALAATSPPRPLRSTAIDAFQRPQLLDADAQRDRHTAVSPASALTACDSRMKKTSIGRDSSGGGGLNSALVFSCFFAAQVTLRIASAVCAVRRSAGLKPAADDACYSVHLCKYFLARGLRRSPQRCDRFRVTKAGARMNGAAAAWFAKSY